MNEDEPIETRTIFLRLWSDFAGHLDGFDLVSIHAGPNGDLYILGVTSPADYREQLPPGGPSFPKIQTDQPHSFRILRCDGTAVAQFNIPDQTLNFYHVQPLPGGEILLAVMRSRRYTDGTYDLNAHAFREDGIFQRAFLLGNGIKDMQTTTDGRIWASYFHEGVYGNFGWHDPIGRSGLVQWDRFGNRLYEYVPLEGIGPIDDCYYLNVASDTEVWIYYYSDFPLVRIHDAIVDGVWHPTHRQSPATTWQTNALFLIDSLYHLFDLSDSGMMHLRIRLHFADEAGSALKPDRILARGSIVILICSSRCYRIDLADLVRDL